MIVIAAEAAARRALRLNIIVLKGDPCGSSEAFRRGR